MKLVSPRSPNLKPLDFSQRVFEREYVFKKKKCTVEELKQNVKLCVANITEEAPSGCITHETKQE